jgi:hypothetical protein
MRIPRPRRPRFALVLAMMLVPLVVVLVLANRPVSHAPEMIRSGPARACASARASAEASAHKTINVSAEVRLPVSVTERIRTELGIATATRSETIIERARVQDPIQIVRAAAILRRSCAQGSTVDAAHSAALQRAYRAALRIARRRASALAHASLKTIAARLSRSDRASAREVAAARARAAVPRVRAQLAAAATPARASSTNRHGTPTASATGS